MTPQPTRSRDDEPNRLRRRTGDDNKYDYDDMIYDVLADDHFHDTKNITVTISISNNWVNTSQGIITDH